MNVILLAFFLFMLLVLKSFKEKLLVLPFLFITGLNLLLIALSEGNKLRYAQEIPRWFPDFDALSFFKKLELGYSSTLAHVFFQQQIVPLVFFLCLMYFTFIHSQKILPRLASILPFLFSLFFTLLTLVFGYPPIGIVNQYGTAIRFENPVSWLPDLVMLALLGCVFLTLYGLFDSFQDKIFVIGIFIVGLASRFLMGFSPTIWASGERTYLFLYGLLPIIVLKFLATHVSQRKTNVLAVILFFCSLVTFLHLIA